MDLSLIRTRKNMIGQLIVTNYPQDPEGVIKMIADQWGHDPRAVIKTIGIQNVFTLNLKLVITWN